MVDSTNVADDPLTAQLVGYYVDGIYSTTAAKVRQRFPHAVLVPISAIGSNAGVVGDVEPGCMTPTQAIRWVLMRRASGVDPSLYVNETYGWSGIRLAFAGAGIPQPHWWVADYDGIAVIPPGAVAKQYANPTLTHGHFDLSVVADYWPGVDGLSGDTTGQLLGETVDPHLLAQLIYLAGLGRTYSGTEGDWLVQIIQSSPGDFTGATLGAVVNSTEGKAWAAKLAAVRGFSADQITAALKDVEPAAPKTGTIAGPITVTFE